MQTEPTNANEHPRCLIFMLCTRTAGAVLVAGAALESAGAEAEAAEAEAEAAEAEAEAEGVRCSSGSNSSTARAIRARSVSLYLPLVDQPPENIYSCSSIVLPFFFGGVLERGQSASPITKHRRNQY